MWSLKHRKKIGVIYDPRSFFTVTFIFHRLPHCFVPHVYNKEGRTDFTNLILINKVTPFTSIIFVFYV